MDKTHRYVNSMKVQVADKIAIHLPGAKRKRTMTCYLDPANYTYFLKNNYKMDNINRQT